MKLWVTAGGTGSAWHIASIVKQYYADEIELYISDINEPEMVASSVLADHFFKVPPVKEPGYAEYMYRHLKENRIDVLIPLIPWEQGFFAPDRPEFAALGIRSMAAPDAADQILNHKANLYQFCLDHDIPVIRQYTEEELEPEKIYFCKPEMGFGAAGACKMTGQELTEKLALGELLSEEIVIQDYCEEDGEVREVTVEAFWDGKNLKTICRRRLESKSGVCTKAVICKLPETEQIIRKILAFVELPMVFNMQFVHFQGCWRIMDVNLRLAAGTGLSNAAGFQLIRAMLAQLLGKPVEEEWFQVDEGIRSILRVYQEVVIR